MPPVVSNAVVKRSDGTAATGPLKRSDGTTFVPMRWRDMRKPRSLAAACGYLTGVAPSSNCYKDVEQKRALKIGRRRPLV